jgi:hypothetical protein
MGNQTWTNLTEGIDIDAETSVQSWESIRKSPSRRYRELFRRLCPPKHRRERDVAKAGLHEGIPRICAGVTSLAIHPTMRR